MVYVSFRCWTGGGSSWTPNSNGNDDIESSLFQQFDSGPDFNIDGTPMMGDVDIHGNSYGTTSDNHHDTW